MLPVSLLYSTLAIVNSHVLTDNGHLHYGQAGGVNDPDSEADTLVNDTAEVVGLGAGRVRDGWTAGEGHVNGSEDDADECESIIFTRG